VVSLLCGQSDVITGLVLNGRPEDLDGDRVLGLFLNTVPFRMQLNGGTWIDLVKRTYQVERERFPFRRYPMAELQKKRGVQPLFDSMFSYTNFHIYRSLGDRIKVLSEDVFEQTNFPLAALFSSSISGKELSLNLHYAVPAFSREQAEAISHYYQIALLQIAR